MARGRKRRIVGWGSVGIGALIAVVFTASRWFETSLTLPGGWRVQVVGGAARVSRWGPMYPGAPWPEFGPWQAHANALDHPFLGWWVGNGGKPCFWIGIVRFERTAYPDFFVERSYIMLWPLAVAATGAGAALILYVRRKCRPRGLCPACGYNLQGLSAETNCPECNTPIRPQAEDTPARG